MIPNAFMIDNAARDVATRFWKDRSFDRGKALHKFMDSWDLIGDERHFVKGMLQTDVIYYLKNAPDSLGLPNWFSRLIMGFVDGFDNLLEFVVNHW